MKKILKQIGKVVCYFMLFVGMQNVVAYPFEFVYGYQYGLQMAATGEVLDQQAFMAGAMEYLSAYMPLIIVVSAILSLLVLTLFFRIRKKRLFVEANMTGFAKGCVPLIVVLAFALQLFITFAMSLLPTEILDAYAQDVNMKFGAGGIITVIAQVLAAPILEEIIFRGLILSRLKKAMPVTVAVIISSLFFALVHGQILWMSYAFLLGIVFCVVAIKTKSILSTILLHFVFNGLSVLLSFVYIDVTLGMCALIAVVTGVISCGALYLIIKKSDVEAVEAVA